MRTQMRKCLDEGWKGAAGILRQGNPNTCMEVVMGGFGYYYPN